MDGVKPVGAGQPAGDRREQMHAGRVMNHLAEVGLDPRIVHEPPVPLDVIDELQMMRKVRAAAQRKEVWP